MFGVLSYIVNVANAACTTTRAHALRARGRPYSDSEQKYSFAALRALRSTWARVVGRALSIATCVGELPGGEGMELAARAWCTHVRSSISTWLRVGRRAGGIL